MTSEEQAEAERLAAQAVGAVKIPSLTRSTESSWDVSKVKRIETFRLEMNRFVDGYAAGRESLRAERDSWIKNSHLEQSDGDELASKLVVERERFRKLVEAIKTLRHTYWTDAVCIAVAEYEASRDD